MAVPFVTIVLDKPYNVRFGMSAQVEFEQLTGINVLDIDENMSITIAAQVLWVMLRRENKDLTLSQATDLVDDYAESEAYVITKVGEAVSAAFNLEGEDGKNK